ncbi:MAG: ATP-binding protein [Anaerolineae bacterium]
MSTPRRQPGAAILRSLAGVGVSLALALWIFYLLMRPPLDAMGALAAFLATTAVISIAAGYAAYRLGWIHRSPRIRWTLLTGYALSSLLTFLNVWVTARLMFTSAHDLMLATVLLLFSGGIAMSLGYFLASAITDRVRLLDAAARELAKGNLQVQAPVTGADEVASLGHTFNAMTKQLQATDRKQRELDAMRRDLVAWAGHDLRTPLASLRVTVEALADGVVSDPATVERYLQTAQRDIRSLSQLVDDLFELAQLDAGGLVLECANNSLSDLISDTVESFSAQAGQQGVRLEASSAPGVDPVYMDALQMGRVLNNLVSNALRHTPAGGTVTVRAYTSPSGVQVEVSDTGEGIAASDLPRVFERFYRGEKSRSRATGGAGLGLAIVRGVVEAHGGAISVESEPHQGSRFHFSLPRSEPTH